MIMKKLAGNAVLAQSGGPTAVIKSSACGQLLMSRLDFNARYKQVETCQRNAMHFPAQGLVNCKLAAFAGKP